MPIMRHNPSIYPLTS